MIACLFFIFLRFICDLLVVPAVNKKGPGRRKPAGTFYLQIPVTLLSVSAGLLALGSTAILRLPERLELSGSAAQWLPRGMQYASPITVAGPPRNYTVFRNAGRIWIRRYKSDLTRVKTHINFFREIYV